MTDVYNEWAGLGRQLGKKINCVRNFKQQNAFIHLSVYLSIMLFSLMLSACPLKQIKTSCRPCLWLAMPPNVCPSEVLSHSYSPRPINLATVLRCRICKGSVFTYWICHFSSVTNYSKNTIKSIISQTVNYLCC